MFGEEDVIFYQIRKFGHSVGTLFLQAFGKISDTSGIYHGATVIPIKRPTVHNYPDPV